MVCKIIFKKKSHLRTSILNYYLSTARNVECPQGYGNASLILYIIIIRSMVLKNIPVVQQKCQDICERAVEQ